MADAGMTHKDLAHLLDVSETTVKSYRRKFPDCIPVASKGKPIRFRAEAAAVCQRIQALFELGMSIAEVRSRLAAEFSWIDEAVPEEAETRGAEEAPREVAPIPARVELPQDFTTAMSGLARSMVNLSQQQNTILKRLQALEVRLEEGMSAFSALQPSVDSAVDPAAEENAALAARMVSALERFEQLLDKLAAVPERETKSEFRVVPLLKSLGRRRSNDAEREEQAVAQEQPASPHAGGEPEEAVPSSGGTAAQGATSTMGSRIPAGPATVTPAGSGTVSGGQAAASSARGATSDASGYTATSGTEQVECTADGVFGATAASSAGFTQFGDAASCGCIPQEPPRGLMQLPLVLVTPQGELAGVAGRARGRFSCSDFKAMLSYAFLPPEQYELRWEEVSGGWMLEMVQPTANDPLNMTLFMTPMRTQRGNEVLCVTGYRANDAEGQPAELHGFIRRALG